MNRAPTYLLEYAFLATVAVVSVLGFWTLYAGPDAAPKAHHHLHVITNFIWLALLIGQLYLISSRQPGQHRKLGLTMFFFAPLLFASASLLSVHSAHKGIVSGQGDFLIVQNVMVTLELAFFIVLAFALRRRRKLHGAMMLATAMLFLGIALFFALIAFAPAFEIRGPETFDRFAKAAQAGSIICLAVGLLFMIRDWRNGWPLLLAAAFFSINELIKVVLEKNDMIDPLTQAVGSMNLPLTFAGSFVVLFALLAATGVQKRRVLMPSANRA